MSCFYEVAFDVLVLCLALIYPPPPPPDWLGVANQSSMPLWSQITSLTFKPEHVYSERCQTVCTYNDGKSCQHMCTLVNVKLYELRVMSNQVYSRQNQSTCTHSKVDGNDQTKLHAATYIVQQWVLHVYSETWSTVKQWAGYLLCIVQTRLLQFPSHGYP